VIFIHIVFSMPDDSAASSIGAVLSRVPDDSAASSIGAVSCRTISVLLSVQDEHRLAPHEQAQHKDGLVPGSRCT
jgi:hypothetical protein